MKRNFTAIFLALLLATTARAEWSVVSTQLDYSLGQRVEYRHVLVENSENGERATLELAIFSSKTATMRVIDESSGNDSLGAIMAREKAIAGTNGGYFDPEFAPVGLSISDGRVVRPWQKAKLLSGVVIVKNGRVVIERASEFSMKSKPTQARQCGPFLVDHGNAITGLNDTRSARRTFVATGANERAAIGYCSQVTLAQLAALLATPELKIQRALNLDGGSSSAFWFDGAQGIVSIPEGKTVRDYLAIVRK